MSHVPCSRDSSTVHCMRTLMMPEAWVDLSKRLGLHWKSTLFNDVLLSQVGDLHSCPTIKAWQRRRRVYKSMCVRSYVKWFSLHYPAHFPEGQSLENLGRGMGEVDMKHRMSSCMRRDTLACLGVEMSFLQPAQHPFWALMSSATVCSAGMSSSSLTLDPREALQEEEGLKKSSALLQGFFSVYNTFCL